MIPHAQPQGDGDPGETIADRVIAEIAATLNLELAEVQPNCSLVHDFGASPFEYVELKRTMERAFTITIPMRQVTFWRTVSDVVSYIVARVQGPEAAC